MINKLHFWKQKCYAIYFVKTSRTEDYDPFFPKVTDENIGLEYQKGPKNAQQNPALSETRPSPTFCGYTFRNAHWKQVLSILPINDCLWTFKCFVRCFIRYFKHFLANLHCFRGC